MDRNELAAGWNQMKKGTVIGRYLKDSAGEVQKLDDYVNAIKSGTTPAAPTLASDFGAGLVKVINAGFPQDAPPPPPPTPTPTGSGLFAGPVSRPIPSNPRVEVGPGQGVFQHITDFGMPPAFEVAVFDSRGQNWPTMQMLIGTSNLKMDNVPVPPQLKPWLDEMYRESVARGGYPSERSGVILGSDRIWQIYEGDWTGPVNGVWHNRNAGCFRGPGVSHGIWDQQLVWASRASGFCAAAGIVLKSELDAGVIPHALAWSTIVNAASARTPALTSDGTNGAYNPATNMQMGTLVQLDPTLTAADFAAMGLSTRMQIICKAMQVYGMYNVDSGGQNLYVERWNNSGSVSIDDGTFVTNARKLLPHLRMIHPDSVPVQPLVLDGASVFNQPHA